MNEKNSNIDRGQKQLKYYAVDSRSEKISFNGVDNLQSSLTETLESKSDSHIKTFFF